MRETSRGHLAAIITILIWGTTFISTRILLVDFLPVEILFFRLCIALIALSVAYPRRLKFSNAKQELMLAAAGLCVTLYFLTEIIALTYTTVANVGVILSASPFFTALFAIFLLRNEKPKSNFYIGFAAAIIGIFLISFNGIAVMSLHPLGDILALAAAAIWAMYSILLKKISAFGCNLIQSTRRIFFYGLVFLTPVLLIFQFEFGFSRFSSPVNTFNLLFLGLGASAACFVTWNFAVRIIGAVKTSIYIYLVPVIAIVISMLWFGENLTWMSATGSALTLAGLIISR